jgi:hypothetical protein
MKQQTAVEYLIEQLFPKALSQEQYYHIEKAKEMEKQNLEKFYDHGSLSLLETGHGDTFEKYYNKTFKNK